MNLLDKAIGIVAPRVALQRVRNRVALELTKGYLERHAQRFRYEGATAGRRAHGWYAASTDANVELMGSLDLAPQPEPRSHPQQSVCGARD